MSHLDKEDYNLHGVELITSGGSSIEYEDEDMHDVDIVEVSHTPGFGDENTITRFKKYASVFSGNLGIICSTVGSGMLGIPYALDQLGLVTGLLAILVFALLCFVAMWLLEEVGGALCKDEKIKSNSLITHASVSYSWVGSKVAPKSVLVLDAILAIYGVGILIAAVIVFCDSFTSVSEYAFRDNNSDSSLLSSEEDGSEEWYEKMLKLRPFWAIVMYLVVVPLSFSKSLSGLKYFSFLILPFSAYFIIIFIVQIAEDGISDVRVAPKSVSGISALSMIMLLFAGHLNFFNVYRELGPINQKKRVLKAGILSTTISTIIYLCIGILGYLYCGKTIQGNFFKSLPDDSVLVIIGRVAIAFNVMIAFPCILNAPREGLTIILSHWEKFKDLSDNVKHVSITIAIVILAVPGFFLSSISVVMGFCGAIGSTTVAFIFPGYYYWALFRKEPTRKLSSFWSFCFFILGLVLMVLGIVLQILDIIN